MSLPWLSLRAEKLMDGCSMRARDGLDCEMVVLEMVGLWVVMRKEERK